VPEVIVGPYPVGFDPIAFYVPITLDWSSGSVGPLTMLGTAPLLYLFSVPVYALTRVNPVWIFKVLGPVLYGSLVWALFRFLSLRLEWSQKNALLGCLFTSIYFVTLRISWDLFRTELGLTFVLLMLPLLAREKPKNQSFAITVLLVLTVVSDELTGVLALLIMGSVIVWDLSHRESQQVRRRTLPFLIGSMVFSAITYSFFVYSSPNFPLPASSHTVLGLPSIALFTPYVFLPLLPFMLLGVRRRVTLEFKVWILSCASLAIITAIPLPLFRETSYRWTLLMDIPVCIIAFTGIKIVFASANRLSKVRLLRGLTRVGLPAIFISLALLYVVLPANMAMPYYVEFPDFIPTSMGQNTIPSYDIGNLVQSLGWVTNQSRPDIALLTHQAIYGWARLYFPHPSQIVDYYYSTPSEGVQRAKALGFSSIYLVWWANGTGWYGTPDVPDTFMVVHTVGDFSVYMYET
jgi:hypothetical protein